MTSKSSNLIQTAAAGSKNTSPFLVSNLKSFTGGAILFLITFSILMAYLSPMGYMAVTSLKTLDQIPNTRILPQTEELFEYEGELYPVMNVPTEDGFRSLVLVQKGRQRSQFIDPQNPEGGLIEWEGRWRTLEPNWETDLATENYSEAWRLVNFPRLLFNTITIAVLGVIGTVVSCTLVAYGFSRFPIPGKNILFLILIATIVLPGQVTLIPKYALFERIGWTGTWLPLIVPHFFANAYNVFLLRQFFLTIPKDLDEAAMIDGANPLQVLLRVIIPQAWPALIAVMLFHFFFAWNDYFEPLIYLLGREDLVPISVGIQQFNFIYGKQVHLIQATALMALVIPVLLFFVAQKYFIQGVKFTGVDK
ncbi:MAG: carbohydrate ABC transporter permease [Ardenticatenaceae bacterium]|nr:carbohydrate ABC transporter permease [Ardenticatenaceae bacterium]